MCSRRVSHRILVAIGGQGRIVAGAMSFLLRAGHGVVLHEPTSYSYEASGDGPHLLTWCESEPVLDPAVQELSGRVFPRESKSAGSAGTRPGF